MTVLHVAAAMLMGAGFATQVSMISAMGRLRGPFEATWVSLVATVAGFTLLMAARAVAGSTIVLPFPFQKAVVYALIGAGYLGPRLGVGLYLSSVIAGQLICSVVLDHIGAFGIPVHRVGAVRVAGVVALMLGVALIRGTKA